MLSSSLQHAPGPMLHSSGSPGPGLSAEPGLGGHWLSGSRISAQILPNFCNAPSVGGWRIQPAQVSFSLALSSPPIGPVPADQPIRGRGRRWWIFPNLEVCTDPAKPGLMLASSSVLGIAETSLGFCLGLAHPVALVPACGKQSQT